MREADKNVHDFQYIIIISNIILSKVMPKYSPVSNGCVPSRCIDVFLIVFLFPITL